MTDKPVMHGLWRENPEIPEGNYLVKRRDGTVVEWQHTRRTTKMIDKPVMHGLWRDDPKTPEGKYLVKRRDGTVVEWPNFTIGAKDPCAPAALRAYADSALARGMTHGYADAVRRLADEFERYRKEHGDSDPDRGQHRKDDPATVAEMRQGRSV